ncbi:hypothetical protein FRC03_007358 [Tulasnella sp. 419]|nr:hypothetical protein FRC03_007358 [Tulasnella sp. 419]
MLMSVGTDFKGLVDSEVPATDNWKALMAYGATRNTGLAACPLITEIFTMKYIPGTPMMQHLNKLSLIRKKLTNAGQPVPDFYYSVAMIMSIPDTADHLEWKAVTSTISLTSDNAELFKPDVIRTKLLEADATINRKRKFPSIPSTSVPNPTSTTVSALTASQPKKGKKARADQDPRGKGKGKALMFVGKLILISNPTIYDLPPMSLPPLETGIS